MLLVKETIEKFGYDPATLSPSSHKVVLFDCCKCGGIAELRVRYYRDDYMCPECKKKDTQTKKEEKRIAALKPRQYYVPTDQVLIDETKEAFGYCPSELTTETHKKVIFKCAICGQPRATRPRYIKENHTCDECTNRAKIVKHNTEQISKGFAPSGKSLGIDLDNQKNVAKMWRKKWRGTPTGAAINRLRTALKRLETGYTTKALPYSVKEYTDHVNARLAYRNHKCPLCTVSLANNNFDIDHKIPLSSATTPEEALALFALENLDVLCPNCNQFVKRDQEIDY